MATIAENLAHIKSAVYGSEVRDAIHDSIKQCYTDVSSSSTLANAATTNANKARNAADTAAANANAKATLADQKATLADNAATHANTARDAANAAVTNANKAQDAANTAASNANAKAGLADTAASNANAKATLADAAAANATTKAELADTAATNANAARDAANKAKEDADTASSNANAKAALADTAASHANDKATIADTAATNANEKATLADNAATNANAARDTANAAASNANAKATLADQKAALANTAAENADLKARLAEEKAALANKAAFDADNAAESVTFIAEQAVSDCRTAIYNTEVAAVGATRAAKRADDASLTIEGMTVSYEDVGPNGVFDVIVTTENEHKNIHFKLKEGKQGSPFAIKGNAYATLDELAVNVTNPEVCDIYNVGADAPYEMYRWTGTKWEFQGYINLTISEIANDEIDIVCDTDTPIAAGSEKKYLDLQGLVRFFRNKIKVLLNAKVDKVTGKQLSTNDFTDEYRSNIGKLEDATVALNNVKVDKVTGKQLSTNDFTNEYKKQVDQNKAGIENLSDEKVDKVAGKQLSTNDFTDDYKEKINQHGQTVTVMTGEAWAALDAAARAALYAEGARVLKVVNGETVTLHGVRADGGLDWLGSNRPVVNLLDNGDFSVAQAGYGGMHGNTPYAADRWMGIALAGVARQGGALTVTPSAYNGRIVQIALAEPGKTYTFAVCGQGAGGPHGRMVVLSNDASATYAERLNVKLEGVACLTVDVPDGADKLQAWYLPAWHGSTEGAALRWAALYEGAYTEDTLPPFTPKGYAAELAECKRYYYAPNRSGSSITLAFGHTGWGTSSGCRLTLGVGTRMRANPTVIREGTDVSALVLYAGGKSYSVVAAPMSAAVFGGEAVALTIDASGLEIPVYQPCVLLGNGISFSADL